MASPLKSWVRTHSPFRNRDKPLPPVPAVDSPIRQAGGLISGNTSPPKTNRKASAKKGTTTGGKGLLSLLKPKTSQHFAQAPTSPSPVVDGTTRERGHTIRTPTRARSTRSLFRSAKSRTPNAQSAKARTPDLRSLSHKVSNLEAQLREARRELDHVLGPNDIEDVPPVPPLPAQVRPIAQPRTASDKLNDAIVQRTEALSQRGRFDGLVENLLVQSPKQPRNKAPMRQFESASLNERPVTRHGPTTRLTSSTASRSTFASDDLFMLQQYAQAEDAYEPVELGIAREVESPFSKKQRQVRDQHEQQKQQLKRKHVEPEQDVFLMEDEEEEEYTDKWREMQRRAREFETSQRQQQPRKQAQQELPQAKRVRWSTGPSLAVHVPDQREQEEGMDEDMIYDHPQGSDIRMEDADEEADGMTALPQISPRSQRHARRDALRASASSNDRAVPRDDTPMTTPVPARSLGRPGATPKHTAGSSKYVDTPLAEATVDVTMNTPAAVTIAPRPSAGAVRLSRVMEEFEWDDAEIF